MCLTQPIDALEVPLRPRRTMDGCTDESTSALSQIIDVPLVSIDSRRTSASATADMDDHPKVTASCSLERR